MTCYEVIHTYKGEPTWDAYWRTTEKELKAIWDNAASDIMQMNGHGVYLRQWLKASKMASSVWAC